MKRLLETLTITGTFLIVFSFLSSGFLQAQENPSIVGTWEYELENQDGMVIFTDAHVIWVLSNKERNSFQGDQPTESEKADAFSSAFADASTYKNESPSRINVTRLYSTTPDLIGTGISFDYEIDGDVIRYWIIQSDGSRGEMGKARRIK